MNFNAPGSILDLIPILEVSFNALDFGNNLNGTRPQLQSSSVKGRLRV